VFLRFDVVGFLPHSTSSDFSSIRRPHLPFVFAFARFRLRPLRLRALAFDCCGIVSLAFDPPGWSSFLATSATYLRIFAFRVAFDFSGCVHSPSMPLSLFHQPSTLRTSSSSAFNFYRIVSYRCVLDLFCYGFFLSRSTSWAAVHILHIQPFRIRFLYARLVSLSTFRSTSGFVSYRSALHVFGFTQLVPFSIYLVAPELRPQGRGVGPCQQNKHQKHQPKTNPKKKKPQQSRRRESAVA
jgi:hypothetical protein